tara:strand:+ start:2873 stop:3076 length:204 start_codon:yes stop_codon:yes gene_type:complete
MEQNIMSEKITQKEKERMLDAICGPEPESWDEEDVSLMDQIEFSIYSIRAEMHTLEKLFWRLKQNAK